MPAIRPRRSALYIPGSNSRAIEKAKTLAMDVVIFDLEDAVAPDMKAEAREQVCSAVRSGDFGNRELVIRVNSLGTFWGESDLAAAVKAAPDAILLPKVSSPNVLEVVGAELRNLAADERTRIWAMIETPHAILHVGAIARAARSVGTRLDCFVIGTNDLAKESRARLTPGRQAMLPWLMNALAAARAENIDILDGVYNSMSNAEGLRAECEQGRDCGFDGKTLIHPDQIAIANMVFAPSEDDVANARAIVHAFEQPMNAGKGAINLNGRMVELLHAEMSKRTLELADAIARKAA